MTNFSYYDYDGSKRVYSCPETIFGVNVDVYTGADERLSQRYQRRSTYEHDMYDDLHIPTLDIESDSDDISPDASDYTLRVAHSVVDRVLQIIQDFVFMDDILDVLSYNNISYKLFR